MKWFLLIVCFFIASFVQGQQFRPAVVHVKVKESQAAKFQGASILDAEARDKLTRMGITLVRQKFPNLEAERLIPANEDESGVRIDLIYEVLFDEKKSPHKVADMLMRTGYFDYAEPAFVARPILVPNDALLSKQWHLEAIRAFAAWDLDTGNSDVVVAITDTGLDWDHPDLIDAIHYNALDLIDGIDNDGNGYVDDYRGWNFFDNTNDPNETSWSHGTHVGGLAGAMVNNGTGVAGTGYACRLLPVKCGSFLELAYGYEGIVYSVIQGADIINCSWGSTDYTAFGHDIVRWATDEGALVVAGCGNNNDEHDFYPASFPEALSVAASDSTHQKADFSTFNYQVDIIAPGAVIYSTKNDGYGYDSGTSMAAPIVAGAAALVKSHYPALSPRQIKARLCESTSNFYDTLNNEAYRYKLGSGLLDMRAALEDTIDVSIQLESHAFTDDNDGIFVQGEEFQLGIELRNLFQSSGPITVTVRSLSTQVLVLDSLRMFPSLTTNARSNNFAQPFEIRVEGIGEYNEKVSLQLIIKAGTYERVEVVTTSINPDYVNVNVNNVQTSVGSSGLIGYADNLRSTGLGFSLREEGSMLYEAGLMIGHANALRKRVVDRVRNPSDSDRDFWPASTIASYAPATDADYFARGLFHDSSAVEDEIGLRIGQRVYAWNEDPHRNYVILEYTIHNTSGLDLFDVYAGVFADWDVEDAYKNAASTAFGKRLAYVHTAFDDGLMGGVQSLNTDAVFHAYCINQEIGGAGGIDIVSNGFTSELKYQSLSTNRLESNAEGEGADVSIVVGTGALHIPGNDSIRVAFAILGEQNMEALLRAADAAFEQYNGFAPGANVVAPFQLRWMAPNPTSEVLRLSFDVQQDAEISYFITDATGHPVAEMGSFNYYAGTNEQRLELSELVSGYYLLEIRSDGFVRHLPFVFAQQ